MLSNFFGFILRTPFPMMTPRYSISHFKNLHFSGLRYRSCISNFSSTWWISCLCHCSCCCSDSLLSGFVWMAMSSMYTNSHPWATSILKISFIIAWNVAGKFIRPKNITRGSKRPWDVKNTALHSSPSLILMLLYPHLMLNFVNRVHLPVCRLLGELMGTCFGLSLCTFLGVDNLVLVVVFHLLSSQRRS